MQKNAFVQILQRQAKVEATGRDRGTHTQTDRQTDAERTGGYRQTNSQRYTQTGRQTDAERTGGDRQTDRQTEVHTERQTDRQTEAERTGADRQTDRQAEVQTNRQGDRPCALATARNTSINRLGRCDVVAPTSFLATTTNTQMHRT